MAGAEQHALAVLERALEAFDPVDLEQARKASPQPEPGNRELGDYGAHIAEIVVRRLTPLGLFGRLRTWLAAEKSLADGGGIRRSCPKPGTGLVEPDKERA